MDAAVAPVLSEVDGVFSVEKGGFCLSPNWFGLEISERNTRLSTFKMIEFTFLTFD